MNSQFTRIVWKEYRAQRMLWFALVLGHVVLSVLSLSMFGPSTLQLTGLAFILSTGFAVGSLAMGFSGEEEDGTAIWPRMLPVSTSTLVAAKLTWTIAAMLGILVHMTAAGLVIAAVGQNWMPAIRMQPVYALQLDDVLMMVAIMSCVVSCSLLCSLRSRRVLVALASCGVLLALLSSIIFSLANHQRSVFFGLSGFAIFAITLSAVFSTRRWHLGRLGSHALPILTKQRTLDEIARTTSLWMPPLKWAASRPSLHVRTSAVLLWAETRRAAWFVACFLGMGFVCCGIQLSTRIDSVLTFLLIVAVVLESGLRSFRHDQQQLNGLFWSHRGVSPGLIWLTRTSVWFLAMVTTVACLVIIEISLATFAAWTVMQPSYWERSFPARVLVELTHPPDPFGYQLFYGALVAGAGGFSLSQLASCWIRKPLLATFVAIIGFLGFCWWTGYVVAYFMPLSLLVWPLIPLILLGAFLTRRQWMDRRTDVKSWIRRGIWIALPLMCLWPVSQLWWAHEIPASGAYWESKAIDRNIPNSLAEQAGYTSQNAIGQWAAAWTRLTEVPPAIFRDHILNETALPVIADEQHATAIGIVDQINAMIDESPSHNRSIPPQLRQPWKSRSLGVATTNVLLLEAKRSAEAGDFDEVTRRIIEAVRLSRLCLDSSANWLDWYATVSHERLALSMLCDYASNDALTATQLVSLNDQLATILAKPAQIRSVALNRFLGYDQIVNSRRDGWEFAQTASPGTTDGVEAWPHDLIHAGRASRQRYLRLCAAYVDYWSGSHSTHSKDLSLWRYSSDLAHSSIDEYFLVDELTFQTTPQYRVLQALVNDEQATQVVLGLQAYRRRHGQFPESLSELEHVGFERHDDRFQDATCQVEFGYAPNGYGEPVPISRPPNGVIDRLDAAQPLLWGHGPDSPQNTSQLGGVARLPPRSLQQNLIVFNNGSGPWNGRFGPDYFQHRIFKQLTSAEDAVNEGQKSEGTPAPFSFRSN